MSSRKSAKDPAEIAATLKKLGVDLENAKTNEELEAIIDNYGKTLLNFVEKTPSSGFKDAAFFTTFFSKGLEHGAHARIIRSFANAIADETKSRCESGKMKWDDRVQIFEKLQEAIKPVKNNLSETTCKELLDIINRGLERPSRPSQSP